jgi:hypothetical protein
VGVPSDETGDLGALLPVVFEPSEPAFEMWVDAAGVSGLCVVLAVIATIAGGIAIAPLFLAAAAYYAVLAVRTRRARVVLGRTSLRVRNLWSTRRYDRSQVASVRVRGDRRGRLWAFGVDARMRRRPVAIMEITLVGRDRPLRPDALRLPAAMRDEMHTRFHLIEAWIADSNGS